jgi:nucleotide-binding universal stress UspA family protein
MKILLAVDGSKNSLDAVQHLIDHIGWYREAPQIELVTVHLPVPKLPGMGAAVSKAQLDKYYQEEGENHLAAAKRKLEAAKLAYEPRVLVGPVAETLVKHAKDKRCELIYIGTRGLSELGKALLGSTATKVIHLSDTPVLLVK